MNCVLAAGCVSPGGDWAQCLGRAARRGFLPLFWNVGPALVELELTHSVLVPGDLAPFSSQGLKNPKKLIVSDLNEHTARRAKAPALAETPTAQGPIQCAPLSLKILNVCNIYV